MRKPNYDKFPTVPVPAQFTNDCWTGWSGIAKRIQGAIEARRAQGAAQLVVAVECYSGVLDADVRENLGSRLKGAVMLDTKDAFKPAAEIDQLVARDLGGDDPVFGYLSRLHLEDFLDAQRVEAVRHRIAQAAKDDVIVLVGPGASLVASKIDLLVYADMPRWEGQLRQRRNEVSNLGVSNRELKASMQYKRAFFIDWRVCDRLKQATMARWDFLLDTTDAKTPKLISGAAHLAGLQVAATRPFRVVPFFDPGPWGGQWMKEVCDLDRSQANFAWCFDCVPEENSLLLEFSGQRVEIPSLNLVFHEPKKLLGEPVYGRFGPEFPIRFDFLDTMGGGNLSFQVHPTTEYAQEHFGIHYTQDESYYMLDAGDDAVVYLGRRKGAEFSEMMTALESAERGDSVFPDEKFAAKWPAKKHDHFLIPAGTLHCSGTNGMVLEISATPYIFTFKLWDWGRMGLDGKPRPLNVARARHVIDWSRDEEYAKERLINRVTEIARGDGWREERTGLHEAEFIETRRHWFTRKVTHDTGGLRDGGVNVLNLIQGEAAVVESPGGAFEPFVVHYAETFIIPAAVGAYTIRPLNEADGQECATLKAFVRSHP